MRLQLTKLLKLLVVLLVIPSCNIENSQSNNFYVLENKNSAYIGQKLPDTSPELFALGIVSTNLDERNITMTPNGEEIYFTVLIKKFNTWISNIVSVKQLNGVWSKPEMAVFSGQFLNDIDPYIQPDGKRLYFISERPLNKGMENKYKKNMWFVSKTKNGWSKPKPVGKPINGYGSVFYPSMTKSGTMYFTRRAENGIKQIYRSKLVNGNFTDPELLFKEIKFTNNVNNAFISPEEDFLIVSTVINKNTFGKSDYYVLFKDAKGVWSQPINLGDKINTPVGEFCPVLSPDGKYFFFQRDRWTEIVNEKELSYTDLVNIYNGRGDIYWVDASMIKDLNPNKIKN